MNTRTKMPTYHVKCVETVYFTVKVEAESAEQAEDGLRDRSPSRGLGDVYKRQNFVNIPIGC